MAAISNVALAISNGSAPNTRKITVTGTLNFDAGDVGKPYRLGIQLRGEDKPDDAVPSTDPAGDDELYTFRWGFFQPYKSLSVTAAGAHSFSESRTITAETLDEDSGLVKVGEADINTDIFLPRRDEIYASVTLSATPQTARSATVSIGVGV